MQQRLSEHVERPTLRVACGADLERMGRSMEGIVYGRVSVKGYHGLVAKAGTDAARRIDEEWSSGIREPGHRSYERAYETWCGPGGDR